MHTFWLIFIPLFVAVDSFGVLPIFLNLTEGLERKQVHKTLLQSVITALVVGLAFLIAGDRVLALLGITIADFMIAGGVLLFVFSISDLILMDKRNSSVDNESLGAVPIGVPLIVGPAVLTTGLLLIREYGFVLTSISLAVNILIAGVAFWFSSFISRILGKTGSKVISKLANLLLAAFGVMMVRKGVMLYF
jgi:multiple antibiotic resistance protein